MNRYQMDMPKIGIRPTIDGRRNGVRESLEDQTMNMALAAANLIRENLRYPNGEPVEAEPGTPRCSAPASASGYHGDQLSAVEDTVCELPPQEWVSDARLNATCSLQDDWCKYLTVCVCVFISSVLVTSQAEAPEEVEPVAVVTRKEAPTLEEEASVVAPVSLGPQCVMMGRWALVFLTPRPHDDTSYNH